MALTACEATSELDPPGPSSDYLRVHFDPDSGAVPTPTDLLRNEEGILVIPDNREAPDAQREFLAYLDGLDGYPLATSIRIPVSGPVDENSLGRGIYVLDADDESVSFDAHYDDESGDIVVEPRQRLEAGKSYRVGVEGYQQGVIADDGRQLIADAPFYLVRSDQDLRDHPDAMPGQSAEERRETAQELAAIQDELQPVFQAMERRNVDRETLAVAFEFTTTSTPAVEFDVQRGAVPIPNDVLLDPGDGTVELPIDDEMDDEERQLRRGISELSGFSMTGAAVVDSTHDIAGDEPRDGVFRLFEDVGDGQWEEVTDVERGRLDSGESVWLRPELALEPDTAYAYVVTDELESSSGQSHIAQPLSAMLRLESPLVDADGNAQVDALSNEQAARLEPLRQRVDSLLEYLEYSEGVRRHRTAAVVPFRTAPSLEPLADRRMELYDRNVSTEVTDLDLTKPSGGAGLLLNDVDTVVRGEMTVLDYIDPETRAFYSDGEPVERSAKFALTLPEPGTTAIDEPVPIVLFGHGLMTSRELLYLVAGELASAGYGAFAVDLPYHGSRALCLRDSSCVGDATCRDDGQCIDPDGSDADVVDIELSTMFSFLEGTDYDDLLNYPVTSGEIFIDMHNIAGTPDSFAQALLDLSQALRVVRGDELQEAILPDPGHNLGDDIVYLGMSLGGILGAGLTAIEPELEDFVLNVPGSDLPRLIEHSVAFETMFSEALEEREMEKGSDAYFEFINAARWLLDPIDPINLAHYGPERGARVMLQMAEGDRVVPNIGTELLAERMGIEHEVYTPLATDHGFLFDPTTLSLETERAREDMIDFFDERD